MEFLRNHWRACIALPALLLFLPATVMILATVDPAKEYNKLLAGGLYTAWAIGPIVYLLTEYAYFTWYEDTANRKKYEHLQGLLRSFWAAVLVGIGILILLRFDVKLSVEPRDTLKKQKEQEQASQTQPTAASSKQQATPPPPAGAAPQTPTPKATQRPAPKATATPQKAVPPSRPATSTPSPQANLATPSATRIGIDNRPDQPIPIILQKETTPFYLSQGAFVAYGFMLGLFGALIIERMKWWWTRANIGVTFGDTDDDYFQTVNLPGAKGVRCDARFIRGSVTNASRLPRVPVVRMLLRPASAKNCRVYLTKIEKWHDTEYIKEGWYADTLRLRWAHEPDDSTTLHEGIDIPLGVTIWFDLFCTTNEPGSPKILQVPACARYRHEVMMNKLKPNNRYRFTVILVGENAEPTSQQREVTIGPMWDDVKPFPDPQAAAVTT